MLGQMRLCPMFLAPVATRCGSELWSVAVLAAEHGLQGLDTARGRRRQDHFGTRFARHDGRTRSDEGAQAFQWTLPMGAKK